MADRLRSCQRDGIAMTYLRRLSELEREYDGPVPKRRLDGLRTPEERRRHFIQRAQRTIADLQLVLDEMQLGLRPTTGEALYLRWRDEWLGYLDRLEKGE